MEVPEHFTARDGSAMRLIASGEAIFGSTPGELESALRLGMDGALFSLQNGAPRFSAVVPACCFAVYAVTNQQFANFLAGTLPSSALLNLWMPWREKISRPASCKTTYRVVPGFEKHPVANVSWFGAEAYSRWAGLRLPTEIEWEKAARGVDGRVFPWGDQWSPERLCWHGSHFATEETAPVDAFEGGSSPHGIYQMAGNVEEWCADWYEPHIYQRYAEVY